MKFNIMKKYKLIKKYPSLPKNWEVGMIIENSFTDFTPCDVNYTSIAIPISEGSDDEFWEEVFEYPYEILLICTNSFFGNTASKIDIQSFIDNSPSTKHWRILSIKRLLDGEIFSIGDKIMGKAQIVCKIEEIWLNPEWKSQILFNHLDDGKRSIGINVAVKVKPLFKTTDGVNICEGDKYWNVYNFKLCSELTALTTATGITFSNKEAAEEWILLNKPVLSINEVMEILPIDNKFVYRNALKDYVKQNK
jgi:hypothetical protein